MDEAAIEHLARQVRGPLPYFVSFRQSQWARPDAWANLVEQQIPGFPTRATAFHPWRAAHSNKLWIWYYVDSEHPLAALRAAAQRVREADARHASIRKLLNSKSKAAPEPPLRSLPTASRFGAASDATIISALANQRTEHLPYYVAYPADVWSRADAWQHLQAQQIPGFPARLLVDGTLRIQWRSYHSESAWCWYYYSAAHPNPRFQDAVAQLRVAHAALANVRG